MMMASAVTTIDVMEGDDDDKKKKLLNKAEDTALMLCVGATNAKQ